MSHGSPDPGPTRLQVGQLRFTMRDDSLASVIEKLSGKRVAVDFEQHVGVPPYCFGETEYFVTAVESIPG